MKNRQKIFYLLFGCFIFILAACKKKEIDPNDNNDATPNVEVLGFASTQANNIGLVTLWPANDKPKTNFIPNNHIGLMLYGIHYLLSGGGQNKVYFGTEIINGYSRIILNTYEGKKVLAEETGLDLMADRHENLYAFNKDLNGNLYLLSHCQVTGYRKVSYVYKISNLLEIERIAMPENISFAVFNTANGLIALSSLHQPNHIELTVGFENLTRKKINLDLTGYKDFEIKGAYQNQEAVILLIVKVVKKQTNEHFHFMFSLDITNNKIIRHLLKTNEQQYSLGKGLIEGNILLIPGSERNTNNSFYLRIDTQTDLTELNVTKVDLESDPQYPNAQAHFLQRLDGDIYIGGAQFGKACYWKNGKLVMLQDPENVVRSYPIEISTHR